MAFLAHCAECGRTVMIVTILTDAELDEALAEGRDIAVACIAHGHRWKLNDEEKATLHKQWDKAKG